MAGQQLWPRRVATLVFLAVAVLLSLAWWSLQRTLYESLPPETMVKFIDVAPSAAERSALVLGWRELGQRPGSRAAEARHIRLRFAQGVWWVSNVAARRRVELDYPGLGALQLRRWELRAGDAVEVGGRALQVVEHDPAKQTRLRDGAQEYLISHDRGADAQIAAATDGHPGTAVWLDEGDCMPTRDWMDRFAASLRRIKQRFIDADQRLARIGGGVDCPDRIAAVGAVPLALELVYRNGAVFAVPGIGSGRGIYLLRRDSTGAQRRYAFSDIERPLTTGSGHEIAGQVLNAARSIIIGSTYYRVESLSDSGLRLAPYRHRYRFYDLPVGDDGKGDLRYIDRQSLHEIISKLPPGVRLDLSNRDPGNWSVPIGALKDAVSSSLRHMTLAVGLFVGVLATAAIWLVWRSAGAGYAGVYALRRMLPRFRQVVLTLLIISAALLFLLLFHFAFGVALPADHPLRNGLTFLAGLNWWLPTLAITLTPERGPRLFLFWLLVSILCALGFLTLELLDAGAARTRWAVFPLKHLVSLSWIFLVITLAAAVPIETWRHLIWGLVHQPRPGPSAERRAPRAQDLIRHFLPLSRMRWVLLRWVPLLLLAFLFLAWLVLGTEEGLGGAIQPMEFGKFAAVVLVVMLVIDLDYRRRSSGFFVGLWGITWRAFVAVGLYSLLFLGVPGFKSDYSPIIILLGTLALLLGISGTWLLAHRLHRKAELRRALMPGDRRLPRGERWQRIAQWLGIVVLVVLAVSVYLGIGWIWDRIENTHDTVAALYYSTPEQRLAVFYKPQDHPELGRQLIESLALIEQTPCYDWERALPDFLAPCGQSTLSPFGLTPPAAMRLAAVQDDFIAAFFINRFGVGGAVVLIGLQVGLLYLLFDAALRGYRWHGGDYADDTVRQFLCFITIGGAILLAVHWLIAWGNALGLLPIMGQPMTFISSANSHLIAMAAPILTAAMLLLRLGVPDTAGARPASRALPPPRLWRIIKTTFMRKAWASRTARSWRGVV